MNQSSEIYKMKLTTDSIVLIEDKDCARTVTNDAKYVVKNLNQTIEGGFGNRRLYYRDTNGRYDELKHINGEFKGFAPCSENQQIFLASL